ncbi:MAG: hypothetical protein ACK4FF_15100 [Limnobacter sp.]|uniref:hypothetical protein n=1 Tax=Limnobacter sp. TaxID=2003368 RepID=UPI00391AD595
MAQQFDALEARKQLLQMKAQLQRMELGADVQALKQEMAWLGTLRQIGGFFAQRRLQGFGPLGALGGQVLQDKFKQHPWLGFVVSTALMRFRKPIAKVALKASLGAVLLAAAVAWVQRRPNSDA